jgi:hypothetical protein
VQEHPHPEAAEAGMRISHPCARLYLDPLPAPLGSQLANSIKSMCLQWWKWVA